MAGGRWMLLVATVVIAEPVAAADLFTPPLLAPTAQQRLVCIANNVGPKPAPITVTIVNTEDGSTAAENACATVAPAAACVATVVGTVNGACKVHAKNRVRGALWLQDAAHDGLPITSLPATK